MKRAFVFRFCLAAIILAATACNFPTNPDLIQEYLSGTQTAQAVDQTSGPTAAGTEMIDEENTAPLEPVSRCGLYSGLDLNVLYLDVYPTSASLMFYIEFPNGVIGLEDGADDGFPWEYAAELGEEQSRWCALLEGEDYSGRLYCLLPLPKAYHNSAKPFSLWVNNCETPIVSIPKQSVVVEDLPAVGSSGGSSGGTSSGSSGGTSGESSGETYFGVYTGIFLQLVNICGAEPSSYHNSSEYYDWCSCMGGQVSCYEFFVEGNWVCDCDLP